MIKNETLLVFYSFRIYLFLFIHLFSLIETYMVAIRSLADYYLVWYVLLPIVRVIV
jgi:hypothetical protein